MIRSMFEPHISLAREPDGEYTLHTVTLTPNTCYGAGRAERGVPPEVRLLPEVESILLHITHRRGRCLQAPKPVRHHLRDLKLGASHGKTTLTAFAMVGDHVVGSASLDVSQLGNVHSGGGGDVAPIDTSDWYAWIDQMPPGPPSFHVRGVVTMPTPGYAVQLQPAAPQGINPKDLILDLKIERLPGVWPQVVTTFEARYDQADLALVYESALIRLPDGSALPLKVETVF